MPTGLMEHWLRNCLVTSLLLLVAYRRVPPDWDSYPVCWYSYALADSGFALHFLSFNLMPIYLGSYEWGYTPTISLIWIPSFTLIWMSTDLGIPKGDAKYSAGDRIPESEVVRIKPLTVFVSSPGDTPPPRWPRSPGPRGFAK